MIRTGCAHENRRHSLATYMCVRAYTCVGRPAMAALCAHLHTCVRPMYTFYRCHNNRRHHRLPTVRHLRTHRRRAATIRHRARPPLYAGSATHKCPCAHVSRVSDAYAYRRSHVAGPSVGTVWLVSKSRVVIGRQSNHAAQADIVIAANR
jgi:hypothetical protein